MSGVPGFRIDTNWQRASADRTASFEGIPSTVLADVMNRMGAVDSGIHAVWPGAACVGSALTVWVRAGDNLMIHKAINMAQPGDVIVVNGQGDLTRALFGELMGTSAKTLGVAGLIFDGVVRDAAGLRGLSLPVFARGLAASGPFKAGPGEIGRPVACGGVVCHSGDIIVADADGVAVIPQADADFILQAAQKKLAQEQKRRDEILHGKPQRGGIDEVLARAGVI